VTLQYVHIEREVLRDLQSLKHKLKGIREVDKSELYDPSYLKNAAPRAQVKYNFADACRVIIVNLRTPKSSEDAEAATRMLVRTIHKRNVKKGWWSDPATGERVERNFGELLMLAVSELAEAATGHVGGLLDDKLPHRPMAEVEIADALIRLSDTAGGLRPYFPHQVGRLIHEPVYRRIMESPATSFHHDLMHVVLALSEALEDHRKRRDFCPPLASAWLLLFAIGVKWGFDVPGAFEEKLAFNVTRKDHDPAVRAAGGLRY
jgi:hypothetical protein